MIFSKTRHDANSQLLALLSHSDGALPEQVLLAVGVQLFLEGVHPYLRRFDLTPSEITTVSPILPEDALVVREEDGTSYHRIVADGRGWRLYADGPRRERTETIRRVSGFVTAVTREVVDSICDHLMGMHTTREDVGNVNLNHWWLNDKRPCRIARRLAVPLWSEVRTNYPESVRGSLDALLDVDKSEIETRGRVIVLYGEPGTGKTTALRALAREWSEWCAVEVVVDPEKLFGDASYLMSVLLETVSGPSRIQPWRLLAIEDADQLLRADGERAPSHLVSRLLNAGDGIIGQGTQTLVAVTTNEPLVKLHPALVRPGRCLATIEFPRFTKDEADKWLGGRARMPRADPTLAELYAALSEERQIVNEVRGGLAGAYL